MTSHIPSDWTPPAAMSRIHLHWTAGGHTANSVDTAAYHILVQGDGTLVRGDKSIAANAPGSGMTPASHTQNANTGAIGVSLCCMLGAIESPFDAGSAPMTETQWQVGMKVLAELARFYEIAVTHLTILTHAEVEPNLNIKQNDKWDITRLAFDPDVRGFRDVGNLMRTLVASHLDGLMPVLTQDDIPDSASFPRYRVAGVSPSTLNFRDGPDGARIGSLTERTHVEFISAVGHWWQVRTLAGAVGWVWSDFLTAV